MAACLPERVEDCSNPPADFVCRSKEGIKIVSVAVLYEKAGVMSYSDSILRLAMVGGFYF